MEFIHASDKAEALAALASWRANAVLMAGGTYVGPRVGRGELKPLAVIHIGRIDEFRLIEEAPAPRLGAAVCLRSIAASPLLLAYRGLRKAAAAVGSWQIQNVGTLGGNLCNAAAVADMAPPFLVHSATVTLESRRNGVRTTPLDGFMLAENQIDRASDEIVVEFGLEPMAARTADAFVKVTCRGGMEFSTASVAVRLTLEDDGETVKDARIAIGAMAPVPFRATEAEHSLCGRRLDRAAISRAGEAALSMTSPRTDVRASADYRRAVLPRILDHALRDCARAALAA